MKKTKVFNAALYESEKAAPKPAAQLPATYCRLDDREHVEAVLREVEAGHIDITASYDNWYRLGFALASAFGEEGRALFHCFSRFYAHYDPKECDAKYDDCLRSNRDGISLATLFKLGRDAGVDISWAPEDLPEDLPADDAESAETAFSAAPLEEELPLIPQRVYDSLPPFLQEIVSVARRAEERDVLLTGALATLSAVMPNIYGIYDQMRVFSNLYFFLTARASSGKGRLSLCSHLVSSIDREMMQQNDEAKEAFEKAERAYSQNKKNPDAVRPTPPPFKKVIIPANTSASAVLRILADNGGRGLLFETEGDTLANSFNSDFGNYSDTLRKAYHHEQTALHRAKDRELVQVETPQVSTVLSGTPQQVLSLIPDVENGLFSRFLFYYLDTGLEWKDVFAGGSGRPLGDIFDELGKYVHAFYNSLVALQEPLVFRMTPGQQDRFNAFFESEQQRIYNAWGDPMLATVRRLGLSTFRIAMILTAVRRIDTGDYYTPLQCSDRDFESALTIAAVLLSHAEKVYGTIFGKQAQKPQAPSLNLKQRFFDALPETFDNATYQSIAREMGLSIRTAENYIRRAADNGTVIARVSQGHYCRVK